MYDAREEQARYLLCSVGLDFAFRALQYRFSMRQSLRQFLVVVLVVAASLTSFAQKRPKITGFDHVAIYVDDMSKAEKFYGETLGYPRNVGGMFVVNQTQAIQLEKAPAGTKDRISHIAFATESAEGMRAYLKAKGVAVPNNVSSGQHGNWFAMTDPAGQPIEFIDGKNAPSADGKLRPVSRQIIHAGFLVRDRAKEELFYKDILGFHEYWHGGMQSDRTDWVALQVPEGTVWIEEMLGASQEPDAHELGVLNHISLGVQKITDVIPRLKEHGWTSNAIDQTEPQMGKDGKWQFNIFDPDLTRVEYMEFKPSQQPCCSKFSGQHPHD